MAGSQGSKYYNIFLDYDIWLSKRGKGKILWHEHFRLLEAIRNEESLQKAADEMEISYRKAWGMIKKAETVFEFALVETNRGGASKGSTKLSTEGNNLLLAYHEMLEQMQDLSKAVIKKFFHKVNQ